ncbi:acyltransferase family protein [Marinomonas ostreistagni]|uniref:Acyltransferase n=1 Tax=Marinomonas ostreistagni TaxID=359209 RepID=A0ABS0ZCY9_9GAMM|nr:acyltransferase [Marinomonas ostreistagni]MBJ7551504.1 acyltransferase [Marinomonas ostreistagni]
MTLSRSELFEGIRLARPLLILFICVAHLPGINSYESDYDQYNQISTLFAVYIKDFLARGAVPILTVISGYLAYYSYQKRAYLGMLNTKIKRLLIPFFVWNIIALCFFLGLYKAFGLQYADVTSIDSFWETCKALLGIYRLPVNAPTYFLRDLFMIMLILPVIHLICQKSWLFVLAAGYYLVYFWNDPGITLRILDWVIPLTFRMDMVLFFALGYFLAVKQIDCPKVSRYSALVYGILLGVLGLLFSMALSGLNPAPEVYVQWRMLLGGLFVCAAPAILVCLVNSKDTPFGKLLGKLSPYSFILFLSHSVSSTLFSIFTLNILHWHVNERSSSWEQTSYILMYLATVSIGAVVVLLFWRKVTEMFSVQRFSTRTV